MQQRFTGYLVHHGGWAEARAVAAADEKEISLYERYKAFISYGYYIARKFSG